MVMMVTVTVNDDDDDGDGDGSTGPETGHQADGDFIDCPGR